VTTQASTRPLRRVPVQGRSVARVQRMLDACAGLVDEIGYEALTTTLLAERAGVAIGSVYQFFPDKRAIVQALAMRNLEAYLARLAARSEQVEFTHWWDVVDAAIDEYIAMHREVAGLLVQHFGAVAGDRLDFALAIAVEAGDALIKLAFRKHPDGDETVLTEAKALIREYLHRKVNTVARSA
jgi:AcrR family transcriptional regulator